MSRHFIIFILLPYSWPDEFIISVRRSLICIPLSGIYILSDEVYRLLEHDPEDRLPAMADAYCRGISTVTVSKPWGAYETLHGPTAAQHSTPFPPLLHTCDSPLHALQPSFIRRTRAQLSPQNAHGAAPCVQPALHTRSTYAHSTCSTRYCL